MDDIDDNLGDVNACVDLGNNDTRASQQRNALDSIKAKRNNVPSRAEAMVFDVCIKLLSRLWLSKKSR